MVNSVKSSEVIREVMQSIRGEITLEPDEKIIGFSECRYGNANLDWDSMLVVTNERILTRPRRDYDAKRSTKGLKETVVSNECFREVFISEIDGINMKRNLDQPGPEVVMWSKNGQENRLGQVYRMDVMPLVGELAGLKKSAPFLGNVMGKLILPLHGLTLLLTIASFLATVIGVIWLVISIRGGEVTTTIIAFAIAAIGSIVISGLFGFGPLAYKEKWKRKSKN
jgi:hypothetical protein